MKNIFVICLLCFGIATMSYGQAVVSIDPAESASPAAGGTLTVNIKISNGTGVAGYNLTVGFDTTALQYVEMKNSTYLPAGAFAAPCTSVREPRNACGDLVIGCSLVAQWDACDAQIQSRRCESLDDPIGGGNPLGQCCEHLSSDKTKR